MRTRSSPAHRHTGHHPSRHTRIPASMCIGSPHTRIPPDPHTHNPATQSRRLRPQSRSLHSPRCSSDAAPTVPTPAAQPSRLRPRQPLRLPFLVSRLVSCRPFLALRKRLFELAARLCPLVWDLCSADFRRPRFADAVTSDVNRTLGVPLELMKDERSSRPMRYRKRSSC